MTHSTAWPATVLALGDMAEERGMKPSELLAELEREIGPMPMPPAGYRLNKAGDLWIGPEIFHRAWILTPCWTVDMGHFIDVWVEKNKKLTLAEAIQLAGALIAACAATNRGN